MPPVAAAFGALVQFVCGLFGHDLGWVAPPPGSGSHRLLCLRCGKDMS